MEWKQIQPGAFRDLAENECRILFIRHGEHKDNITYPAEAERLIDQGRRLAAAGITISGAISSSADRAISAVYFTKTGLGTGGYTTTVPRLADMRTEDPGLRDQLKADAKIAGVEAEEYIFHLTARESSWQAMMQRRGEEGATALREFSQNFCGKTILSASHGGSRMEVTISALANRLNDCLDTKPEVMLDRGQIAELILDVKTGNLLELYYLEPLKRNA